MGYKEKREELTLHQQAYQALIYMLSFGESKRVGESDGTARKSIYSASTYQSYWKHIKQFLKYVKEQDAECKNLKDARKYYRDWLDYRAGYVNERGEHLSAWTIQLEAKALGKLFGISPEDPEYYVPPKRHREDIKRSRGVAERDKHFSEKNNQEFVNFCRGTGCRRNILEKLRGEDLFTLEDIEARIEMIGKKEELEFEDYGDLAALLDAKYYGMGKQYYIHHRNDKGGRNRYSMITGPNVNAIVKRMTETPATAKVWNYVPTNADVHSYRADYATEVYKEYARPIEEIPFDRINPGTNHKFQSGVYVCRKDERGKKLDKDAMYIASKALGHNRLDVIANHYIRGI